MKKILIVEDDPILLKMYENKFKNDYEVISATDGEKGFDETIRNKPDFILLDLKLPKIAGWDLLHRLKETPDLADIPVAALTVMQDDIALKEDPKLMSNLVAYWRKDQNTPAQVFENVKKYLEKNG